jgi:recombination protein RecR
MRLVLHLLKQDPSYTISLTTALNELKEKSVFCTRCHNISDAPLCGVCSSAFRDQTTLCVVEDTRDVMAIENTGQFRGVFHVLGGVISPLQGIGPDQLHLDSLLERVKEGVVQEIILALSPTMEGDTTCFYLSRKLRDYPVTLTTLARGVPLGGELEYADEVTLGRSIVSRVTYKAE